MKVKAAKKLIVYLLAFALLVRIIVFFAIPIGSLSHEEKVIKDNNGEIIYVRGNCPWSTGNAILFAGIVTRGDSSFRAFYVLGDTEREWLYVVGWRFQGFYQRAETAR